MIPKPGKKKKKKAVSDGRRFSILTDDLKPAMLADPW